MAKIDYNCATIAQFSISQVCNLRSAAYLPYQRKHQVQDVLRTCNNPLANTIT